MSFEGTVGIWFSFVNFWPLALYVEKDIKYLVISYIL